MIHLLVFTCAVIGDIFPSPSGGTYGSKTPPVQLTKIGVSLYGFLGKIPLSFILDLTSSSERLLISSLKLGSSTLMTFCLRNNLNLGFQCFCLLKRTVSFIPFVKGISNPVGAS